VPQCLELDDEWNATKEDNRTTMLDAEYRSMRIVLEHMTDLDIVGGTLFIDGRMVAFTYGAAINYDTFDVCVEKADVNVEGSYAAINQAFVNHLPERFCLVNREEDLGVEGLRRAKLSYQPTLILEKFSVLERHPLAQPVPPCQKKKDEMEEQERIKAETRALWKEVFCDSEEFMDLYFGMKYRPELNVYHEEDGHVVSALQCLPYTMTYGHDEVEVAYVSGVSTREDLRNRGLMSNLLDEAHRRIYSTGAIFSLLIPAEPWLFGYYERFGYNTLFCESQAKVDVSRLQPDKLCTVSLADLSNFPDETDVFEYFSLRMRERDCCIQHSAADFRTVLADLKLFGGKLWIARLDGQITGVAVSEQREQTTHVFELLYDSIPVRDALLSAVVEASPVEVLYHEPCKTCVSQHRMGQLRVVNVLNALRHYVGLNPDVSMDLRIHGDKAIPENNGLYRLSHGRAERLSAVITDALPLKDMSNVELAAFLMEDREPYLSLMLN
jgi:predicted acetyltransferase